MRYLIFAFLALIISSPRVEAQSYIKQANLDWELISFDEKNWKYKGAVKFLGENNKNVITLKGKAISKKKIEENYSIEMKFKDATWPVLYFNSSDLKKTEKIYLRTFMSGEKEAIQYNPINNGFTPWRIYGNEQAPAVFDKGWNVFRIDVVNHSAYVYINDAMEPVLIVKQLRNRETNGFIGFGALYEEVTVEYFKYAIIDSEAKISIEKTKDILYQWQISQEGSILSENQTFGKGLEKFSYPNNKMKDKIIWETIETDYDGILDISKYRNNKDSLGNTNFVYATTNINSIEDRSEKLVFGFCDLATVYLNGEIVFSGFIPLKSDLGYIRAKMDNVIPIELKKGENELFIISSGYDNKNEDGGWGLLAKILPK